MVFNVQAVDAFEFGESGKTIRELPYVGYLRYMYSPDNSNKHQLKFDLEITDMGYELLDRNPAEATDYVENRYDNYPEGFNPADVNDLQKQLESIQNGEIHPSVKLDVSGGTFNIEDIIEHEVRGYERIIVQGTITTPGVITITSDELIELAINTGET